MDSKLKEEQDLLDGAGTKLIFNIEKSENKYNVIIVSIENTTVEL